MSSQAHYFRVGLFVLAAVSLAVVAVLVFGSIKLGGDKPIPVETYFKDTVQGLTVGSRVKRRGVTIGQVDSISFAESLYDLESEDRFTYGAFVVVRMSIYVPRRSLGDFDSFEELVADRVSRGLRVRLGSEGITGQKFMDVDILDPARHPAEEVPWTPDMIYIPASPTVFKEILETFAKVGRRLEDVDLSGMADDLRALVSNLRTGTDDLDVKALMTQMSDLLTDLQTVVKNPDISASLAHIREFSAEADEVMEKAGELLTGDQVEGALANMADTMANIENVTDALNGVVERLNRTLARVDGVVQLSEPELDAVLNEMQLLITNLRELTDMAKRYPANLILGEAPPAVTPGGER